MGDLVRAEDLESAETGSRACRYFAERRSGAGPAAAAAARPRRPLRSLGLSSTRSSSADRAILRARPRRPGGATARHRRSGSPSAADVDLDPEPGPGGGCCAPSARGGRPVPWSTETQVWKSHVCTRRRSGVPRPRCTTAAVTRLAPPASSTVTSTPSSTATSRISMARVMPPTRWSLIVIPSATPSRWARRRSSSVTIDSSSTSGRSAARRTDAHSAYVRHGCSKRVLEVAGRPQEAACAAGGEGAVRVGEEHDLVTDGVAHRGEPLGVGLRDRADLDLEPAVPVGDELAGERDGLVHGRDRDDVVERDGVAEAGAERLAQRPARPPARSGPSSRHVERRT